MPADSDSLAEALVRHEIQLPSQTVAALGRYCQLLWQWNEKLNLTRHLNYEQFVSRDVVDSIELANHLVASEEVLDVGSGGGVPGVILALLRPDVHVSLCESVGKKAKALEAMVGEVGLSMPVYHERAEHVLERRSFGTLTVRAVGPLWKLLKWLAPHWDSIGRILLVKGQTWVAERAEARHRGCLRGVRLRRLTTYVSGPALSVILELRRST
jgi:16S rRNA (guanine527-N7)-methyltransferase